MDFLKSAVASAIASGPPFPYTFGDRVDIDESIWTLHNGTKKVRRTRPIASTTMKGFTGVQILTGAVANYRKTVPTAASSPSTSPPTKPDYHSPRTLLRS